MTEAEWLASTDPIAMLDWAMQLHFRPSDRKLRLAMCAMSRASGDHSMGLLRRINLAERWADGEIDRETVVADEPGEPTSWRDWIVAHHIPRDAIEWASQSYKWVAPHVIREVFGNPFQQVALPPGEPCRECHSTGTIVIRWYQQQSRPRDYGPCQACLGTGHGPSPVLTPLVLQLAEAAYTMRTDTGALDNDALAVLSDALEEAGLEGESRLCRLCNGTGIREYMATYNRGSPCVGCYGAGMVHEQHPILAHLRSTGPHYRGCWALDLILGKE